MNLMGRKTRHLDLKQWRNEYSKLHIQWASTHKQRNASFFYDFCIG
jgi:hypothetical protein